MKCAFLRGFNYHKHLRDHGNYENKLLGERGKGSGKAGTAWPSLWTEQLRALRDIVLSRVLIVGTPARFGAGTPAVKVASSKRRNSPEFTCRARVFVCVEKLLLQLVGNCSHGIIRALSVLSFRASGAFMFTRRREIWMMLAARYALRLG